MTPSELTKTWGINYLSRKPAPTLDGHHSKDIFPSAQSDPPLVHLCAISACQKEQEGQEGKD